MHARFYEYNQDYKDLLEWWKWWGKVKNFPPNGESPPPAEGLPRTGIIVENNGKKICCAFIYKTDSTCCALDWFISNPKIKKEDRVGCVDYLILSLLNRAINDGFKIFYCLSSNKNIQKKMIEEHKFARVSEQKLVNRV